MAWLEVESKIRIKNSKEMRKKVKTIANFEKKEKREDEYFAIRRKRFGIDTYPQKAFRVRETASGVQINFKKWLKKYWDKDIVVKQEFELSLKNKNEVEDILELFKDIGFVRWMKKTKTSEFYSYKKDKRITIEINNVKNLGWFLEIEYLCHPHEINLAKIKIRQTLERLDIDPKDIDNTGYTKMLWNKKIKGEKIS